MGFSKKDDLGRDPLTPVLHPKRNADKPPADLKRQLQGTWRKLKISMIFIVVLIVFAIGLFVFGGMKVSKAANLEISRIASLTSGISTFSNGGYIALENSTFSITFGQSYVILNSTEDPDFNIVEKNAQYDQYDSLVFEAVDIRINSADFFNETDSSESFEDMNSTISFTINYTILNSSEPDGNLTVNVPYYKITQKTSSLHAGQEHCVNKMGYYNKTTNQCFSLYVLSGICVKLENDSNGWHLNTDDGGSGCTYPFNSPGIYSQRNYSTEDPFLFASTNIIFMIRSFDDPYILLQSLTNGGLSINNLYTIDRSAGIHLIILAVIFFCATVTLAIILFFAKRRVKRGLNEVSQIPNFYSRPPMYRYLIFSLANFGLCIGVGFPLLAHWSELAQWTYTPFAGLMIILWAGPLAVVSLLIFWQMMLKSPLWTVQIRSYVGSGFGAILIVLCALAIAVLMKPSQLTYTTNAGSPDLLQVFFGIVIMLSFLPLATLMFIICVQLFLYSRTDRTKNFKSSKSVTRRALPNVVLAVVGMFILFVVFLATSYLPPLWNMYMLGYNTFQSPFSIVPSNHSSIAVMKLYLDVVVFYGFILAVVIVALMSSMSGRVRRVIGHWIRVRIGKVIVNTSVGEICFLLLVATLAVWWFWWWYFGYSRIAQTASTLERLARTLGHMTNLFAAVLLFPVTRNSVWVEILGIPFERAVKYHRWSGVVVFVAVTAHMIVWWIKWSMDGTLLNNIFSVQNKPHADNWSIPMVELTWLGAAVMVILSQSYFRRRRFELFYYTHHFFIVFYVTGLIHAWSMWYFTGGGMILWFVDRLIRFYKSSKTFQVLEIRTVHGDTTVISLQPNGFAFRSGQYAFINIPALSPLEWHPFSISSAPGDTTLNFHIKNMGKSTWTSRLQEIYGDVQSVQTAGQSSNTLSDFAKLRSLYNPIINIDGPYGNPPDFTKHKNVLFVAGGIGITPLISVFKDLLQQFRQDDSRVRHIKKVYLMWVVRDLATLNMFKEVFDELHQDEGLKSIFRVMFRVTQRSFSAANNDIPGDLYINPAPVMGRPNIQQEFSDIASSCGEDVVCMVCGPEPMVREVQNAAYNSKFELHMETFEL